MWWVSIGWRSGAAERATEGGGERRRGRQPRQLEEGRGTDRHPSPHLQWETIHSSLLVVRCSVCVFRCVRLGGWSGGEKERLSESRQQLTTEERRRRVRFSTPPSRGEGEEGGQTHRSCRGDRSTGASGSWGRTGTAALSASPPQAAEGGQQGGRAEEMHPACFLLVLAR